MLKKKDVQTIVIRQESRFGLWGVIVGFVGIFALSFILSPLAFILGVIGIFKGQIGTGLIAIFFSVIGALTSVILMGFVGLSTMTFLQS